MKIDAHCHTDCSDGNLSIEERVDLAHAVGLAAVTITDHDFISEEQVARAQERAEVYGMPFVPGIELSLSFHGSVVHILGYFLDPGSPLMQEHIKQVQETDKECTIRILKETSPLGIEIKLSDLVSPSLHTFYSMKMVKRVAADLFQNDPRKTLDVFLQAMARSGINYVDFAPFPVNDGIDLIHRAGGIAVLAHPGGRDDVVMRRLGFLLADESDVRTMVEMGIDGIEVSTPVHTSKEKAFYTDLARKFDLLTTAGSDCHGDDPYLGPRLMGIFSDIPDDLYEQMLKRWRGMNR